MIVIIDSTGANISSIMFAIERIGYKGILTNDIDKIYKADHVILPGVGSARKAMENLNTLELVECIQTLTQPVLGICLGMQLLFEFSDEGDTPMLNIINDHVSNFNKKICKIVPHMGWNTVFFNKSHPITFEIEDSNYFYFVHSYYAKVNEKITIGITDYGNPFSAIVVKNNFMGCQFHPERSGKNGEKILKNFLKM